MILAKTIKGWTLGTDFEARNATHQIKKMKVDDLKDVPRPLCTSTSPTTTSNRASCRPTTTPGTDSPEYEYLMERRRALDGFLPERVERSEDRRLPARRDHRPAHGGHRREGAGVDDDRVHALVAHADEGTGVGTPRRADHPRRGAHVRHGRAVPRVQDLRAVRAAVRTGRRRADAFVPRVGEGPDPRRGDHRSRLDGRLHRGGDRVRDVGSADDPVLHLLLDVRVPARRRPHLVVRRPARPRLPDGRDRGPHDAHRRRPATLRRPVAACTRWRIRTAARTTRRSRTRSRSSCATASGACTDPTPRTASTTSRSTTRTTRSPRCPKVSRTASSRGLYRLPRRAEGEYAHRAQILASGTDGAAGARGAAAARRAPRRRRRRVERHRVGSSCATTRSSASVGTGCTRRTHRARRT